MHGNYFGVEWGHALGLGVTREASVAPVTTSTEITIGFCLRAGEGGRGRGERDARAVSRAFIHPRRSRRRCAITRFQCTLERTEESMPGREARKEVDAEKRRSGKQ